MKLGASCFRQSGRTSAGGVRRDAESVWRLNGVHIPFLGGLGFPATGNLDAQKLILGTRY
jgi:hypothetical protein